MTAAPTASSTVSMPPVCGLTELQLRGERHAADRGDAEQITKPDIRTTGTLMPARRAASALPPTA